MAIIACTCSVFKIAYYTSKRAIINCITNLECYLSSFFAWTKVKLQPPNTSSSSNTEVLLSFVDVTIVPQPSSERVFSPSAIKVTWTLPLKNQGVPIAGFYLHIKEKESSSLKPKTLFENIITLANASQTSLVIRNLSILTKYQVRMAAYYGRKVGNYSPPIIAGK